MKLSIIIVNYNVQYFLEQCLLTVEKAIKNIDAEVFVVDNHSVDGSCAMVRKHFPRVHLIDNEENVGFSKANNQAIRLAKGEYVLLLNPDTVVPEDCFEKCIQFMDATPDSGALGVKMIDGKGRYLPESKRGLPTPEVALYKMLGLNKIFPKSKRFGKYHLGYLDKNEVHQVEVLAGAFMLIKSKVLDEIGLLDESFFMYGEDIDLSYRINLGGYQNYYYPHAPIIHYKGESTKKMSVNYVFIFYRAMVLFAQKHYHGRSAKFLTFLIQSAIYLRASLAVVHRFISKTWIFFVDVGLLYLGMFFLKNYWEEHIKFIDSYPDALMNIHVPYYIFLWVLSVYMSGGYEKPYSIKRILRGIIVGTVLITAVYGLFPNELRFSRALIFLGAIWATISMLGIRMIQHFRTHKNFALGARSNVRAVIVGNAQERKRIADMMLGGGSPINLTGFVSVDPEEVEEGPEILGTLERLADICEVYKIEEVIFCAKDLSSAEIMKWMGTIDAPNVFFKIVPEERYFVIGSNSKNSSGEFYTEEIHFKLAEDYNRRKKRFFDFLLSTTFLVLSPILMWFASSSINYFKYTFNTLIGNATWVSYDNLVKTDHLPKLKKGIFFVSQEVRENVLSGKMRDKLNLLYAKNYSIETDLSIVLKCLFRKK